MTSRFFSRRGFTLIELLLVIGIIAILASIVIVAINPTKQLADARNAQRRSDVNTVLNAVYQYAIDEDSLPAGIDTTLRGVCITDCTGYVAGTYGPTGSLQLNTLLEGTYVVALPRDPSSNGVPTGSTEYTGYDIQLLANGRVEVSAPVAERSETISAQR